MKNALQIMAILMVALWFLKCEPSGEKIIGSRDHDIHSAHATLPQILADGIATTEIVANVRTKDGVAAEKIRVHFETDYGHIDKYAITDNGGNAKAILTSAASDTDIVATVTATVMDTTFSPLSKSDAPSYHVKLTIPGFGADDRKIKSAAKVEHHMDNRATIKVKFLGVDLQATVEDSILTADGVSETRLEIRLRETTSRKAIEDAEIRLLAIHGTIQSSTKTNNQGVAEAYLKAARKIVIDTLFVAYGNEISRRIVLKYLSPKFELYPKKARIPADGISKVQMIATLKTQQNTPIVGAKIRFSSTNGIIPESVLTDNYGQAVANLISDYKPDSSVKVFARFASLRDSAIIAFGAIDVSSIHISSDGEPLLRDGKAIKQISLYAKNSMGLPVPNIVINLKTTHGMVPETVVTDHTGSASFQFEADAGNTDATATITASVGSVQASQTVKLLGITMTISANPASILADGKSTAIIRVELKQTTSHVAIPNHSITFAANVGLIATTATTDQQGVATATYTASTAPAIATITISCGALIGETKVALLANYPKTITLTTDSEPILRDGITAKTMTLTATNELGQPVPNVAINLQANLGSVPSSVITDQQGTASFKYTSDAGNTDATATITASVGTLVASQTVKLLGITMTISANPTAVLADAKSTATIRVEVKQSSSHLAVANHPISFATTNGTIPTTATTDQQGVAIATYTASFNPGSATVTAHCGTLTQSVQITLLANYPKTITLTTDSEPILRDGIATKTMTLTATNELGQPVPNVLVNLQASLGSVPSSVITDQQGTASFKYTSDAGNTDATATITASVGSVQASQTVKLLGITMTLSANPDSIAADGKSTSSIQAELKQTSSQIALANYPVSFSADNGTIPAHANTNERGVATTTYQSSTTVGRANITVTAGQLSQKIVVCLFGNYPNSIVLATDQNFISVKGTGQIQQAIITATILGVTGQPVGNNYGVRFRIVNGPGGGEMIEPSGSTPTETMVIRTVNGIAQAKLLAGTVSGTVQVRAELVDYPYINAQTTNIVIRSGPAYMWVDSTNINHVIQHATLTIESGKFNVCFANPVHEIKVTAYFADKYNNPVENGTVVYFTTTGGMITTNAVVNEQGKAEVILQDVNPFPYLKSSDPNQLTALNIPNPNNEIYNDSLKLPTDIPDFEFSEVYNSMNTLKENDGVAVILAYTWGKDQNNKDIKVWIIQKIVFSRGVIEFTASSNPSELALNESATITIRVYDVHGNPVAAGSKLTVSTDAGKLSETNLMPSAEKYGYGATKFQVTLTNDLKSTDQPKTAHVTIELNSPNGDGKLTIPINLKNTP